MRGKLPLAAAALTLFACSSGHNAAGPETSVPTSAPSSNYCGFASLAEMPSATELSLTRAEHPKYRGCLYKGGNGYVKLQLFPTSDWDAQLSGQVSGANSTVQDVPGLGAEAKRVSPDLFVKTNSLMSFKVLVSPSQSQDDEVAVARVLLPRISAS